MQTVFGFSNIYSIIFLYLKSDPWDFREECMLNVCPFVFSGLSVEWTENDQRKKIINVPTDVYELGCIQDVEDGLKVSMSSNLQFMMPNVCHMCCGVLWIQEGFIYPEGNCLLFLNWIFACMLKCCVFPLPGCREGGLPSNGEGLRGRWRKRNP